jgi:8-oxo-dGTP pyrophosphatase MutT (NUDIX family)
MADNKFKPTNDAVTIIAKNEKEEILLQQEYSYPPNIFLYQFPGGSVEEDEDLETAANRELMEEADYKAGKLEILGSYYSNNRRSSDKMHVFLGTYLQKESLEGDAEEDIQSFWFTESEIDKLIHQRTIENIHVLSSWSLYKATNSKTGKVL